MSHAVRNAAVLAFVLLVAASAGCSHRLQKVLLPESRPEIRLTHERLAPPNKGSYAWLARWAGSGMPVEHYLYAIDPAAVDVVDDRWVSTTETQQVLTFPVDTGGGRSRPHVFAVRAVSPGGTISDPAWFAFSQNNLPPSVQITQPAVWQVYLPLVLPDVTFRWDGTDPDGQTTQVPVRYVFRLFSQHNPDAPTIPDFIAFALVHPDSLMAMYAPEFTGWTSVSGESTSTRYTGLAPGEIYLFAITAFDEAGDYDPIFANGRNMGRIAIVPPGAVGPVLTMYNEFFNYTYPAGGYTNDVAHTVSVSMPAGRPLTVNWVGEPVPGSDIHGYRWVLAPVDLFDETPRSNEATDLHHWSARSRTSTSATLPAISPPVGRRFTENLYIEVEDTNGLRSLGIVEIVVQPPVSSHELLFVNDTNLRPDFQSGPPGTIDAPAGPWPTMAELDTFLFAKGGYPWRGYPAGTISTPGILNGYDCDTISTRGLTEMPLAFLSTYRHVIWCTDETNVFSLLRRMSSPGHESTLAAYVAGGGRVWLCGGGAAYATLADWNAPNTSPLDYSNRGADAELRPGRFMYDFAHWRVGIQTGLPAVNARKFGTTTFGEGTNRPGRHWPPNPPPPTPPTPPDYALLPANLDPKNVATDPPPPLRNPDSFWLRGTYNAEVISLPTLIREDYNDDPNIVEEYSTLDTLYITRGGTALANSPVMTYYHGRENQALVFSGFNLWYWRRTECIGLVDWVLQSVWGLPRDSSAPRAPAGPVSALSRGGARQ